MADTTLANHILEIHSDGKVQTLLVSFRMNPLVHVHILVTRRSLIKYTCTETPDSWAERSLAPLRAQQGETPSAYIHLHVRRHIKVTVAHSHFLNKRWPFLNQIKRLKLHSYLQNGMRHRRRQRNRFAHASAKVCRLVTSVTPVRKRKGFSRRTVKRSAFFLLLLKWK